VVYLHAAHGRFGLRALYLEQEVVFFQMGTQRHRVLLLGLIQIAV